MAALAFAAGCSHLPDAENPVTWWHDLEGGAIAQQRPPPPGADQPYPNLASVPPKPTPPDSATRTRIAAGLLQDRTNAQYVAAQAPVAPLPRATVPAKPAAADPDASSASLAAVQAPPAKAAPNPPQAAIKQDSAAAPNVLTVPDAPPPPPVLAGLAIGPTTPVPPPKAPPAPQIAATPGDSARAPVPVAFTPGSAVLPASAEGPLRQLAARRASAAPGLTPSLTIDIIGFGEASDTAPQVQSAGITLGLQRAHAVAAALIAAGVPANALRIAAQASGRGADARLVAAPPRS
jgi:outer membrane protein OmpA-like peptidoglycan-associated protein